MRFKLLTLIWITFGTQTLAQTCGDLCIDEFWATSTLEEIDAAIRGADVHARDAHGYTSLHIAAYRGTPDVVMALIEAGADVNARSEDGSTPLHAAAYHGSLWAADPGAPPDNMRKLLEAGAGVNAQSADGSTPLHLAAMRGTPEIITILLEAGADVAAVDSYGQTPWEIAAEHLQGLIPNGR